MSDAYTRTAPWLTAARSLAALGAAAVMLACGFTWYSYKDLTSGLHTSNAINVIKPGDVGYVAPHSGDDVNLLLIGLDSRKDMNGNDLPTQFVEQELHAGSSAIGGYNTNVLILMHIPANGGAVTAFSIPRDDYVEEPGGSSTVAGVGEVPDLGMHKIKEAYGRAKAIAVDRLSATVKDKATLESETREVGREATLRAVQLLTGVHIDHIAEINLLGFYDIAQAVGPIQVCLNHPVYDPIENGAGTGLKLPAGLSTLDAATALQFVRQRYHLANGDLDRTHRQQAFLSSVVHKLKGEGVIGDLGKMQSLFDVVKKDVVIDNNWDVLDFASRASSLTGGHTVFYTLPITGFGTEGGESVNTVDPAQIKSIVTSTFNNDAAVAPSPAPSSSVPQAQANVEVYNATSTVGLAADVAQTLSAAGWPAAKTGNAATKSSTTTIVYGSGAQTAAQQIAAKLGLTAKPTAGSSVAAGTVVIDIGSDYKAPSASSNTASGGSSSASTSTPPVVIPTGGANGNAVNMSSGNGIPCVN